MPKKKGKIKSSRDSGDEILKAVSSVLLSLLDDVETPIFFQDDSVLIGRCLIDQDDGLYYIIDENGNIISSNVFRKESAVLIGYYHQKKDYYSKKEVEALDRLCGKCRVDCDFYKHSIKSYESKKDFKRADSIYERYLLSKNAYSNYLKRIHEKCSLILGKR